MGADAVVRSSGLLSSLVASNNLADNIESVKNYMTLHTGKHKDLEVKRIFQDIVNLNEPPRDEHLCREYSHALYKFRQTLVRSTRQGNNLYGERYSKYRVVKLLADYSENFNKLCGPILVDTCEEVNFKMDRKALPMLKLVHHCPHNILKPRRAQRVDQRLIALECTIEDYNTELGSAQAMESRWKEVGEMLIAVNRITGGEPIVGGLAALVGRPQLVGQLYERHLLEPCRQLMQEEDQNGHMMMTAVDIGRAAKFEPSLYKSIAHKVDCLGLIRRTMVCDLILRANKDRLVNKIAGL